MSSEDIGVVDIVALAVYFVLVMAVGLWVRFRLIIEYI